MKTLKLILPLVILVLTFSSFNKVAPAQEGYLYTYWLWNKGGTDVYYYTEVIALPKDLNKYSKALDIIHDYFKNNVAHERESEFTYDFDTEEKALASRKKEMDETDYVFGKFKAKAWAFPFEIKQKIKKLSEEE
uniref:hypothetical protein n=1 Tax=Flavobacterium sp. TaxID=239 RepID=UPI00404B264C